MTAPPCHSPYRLDAVVSRRALPMHTSAATDAWRLGACRGTSYASVRRPRLLLPADAAFKLTAPSEVRMTEAFGVSDPGSVRPNNEDSFLTDEELSLFVVADGMGG